MYYNDLLSTNEKIYEGNIVSSFLSISKEQIRKIYDIEKEIKKVLCNPLKSFETRATFDSKNRSTFSQNSSISLFNQVSFNESGKNSFINSEKERESNK